MSKLAFLIYTLCLIKVVGKKYLHVTLKYEAYRPNIPLKI